MKRQLGWRAVEWIAGALDRTEREAVLGDFAESGERWNRAIWDVFGLVIRREAALWRSPRPWPVLIVLVIPLGLLISVISRISSGGAAVYVWMYANNSNWDLIRSAGFWYVLSGASLSLLIQCLALVCSSWTVGFVIGSVSGKYARSNAFVLMLILLAGELSLVPRYLAFSWQLPNELFNVPVSDPVSAIFFYRVMFPLIVQIALVAVPALFGVLAATQLRVLHPLLRACICMGAITTIATLVIRTPGFGLLFYRHPLLWLNGPLHLLQWVTYWPIPYLLTVGIRARLSPGTSLRHG